MLRSFRTAAIVGLLVHVLVSRGAAGDYFPSDPGPEFDYTYGRVTIGGSGSGPFYRILCDGCIVGGWDGYRFDQDGDVFFEGYGYFADGAPDPDSFEVSPGLKYLDFPLEMGKSWSGAAQVTGNYGQDAGTVTLSGTVSGPKVVAVPAGEFEVVEVVLRFEYSADSWRSGTQILWLHRQLGPVNDLEAWSGIVPTVLVGWGALKAGYR